MKIRSFIYVLLSTLICASVFCSCSDDEPQTPNIGYFFKKTKPSNCVYWQGSLVPIDNVKNQVLELVGTQPKHPVSVTVDRQGSLKKALKSQTNGMDALIVNGPINYDDMRYMVSCAEQHYLINLDLSNATIENNTISECAFMSVDFFETEDGAKMMYSHYCPIFHIKFPNTLETIGFRAFCNVMLSDLQLPGSLRIIDSEAFRGIMLLGGDLIIPKGVKYMGTGVFYNCTNIFNATLDKISIPGSLKDIPNDAFMYADCEHMILNEGIENIYHTAFSNAASLSNITLPSTIKYLEYLCFGDMPGLNNLFCRCATPPEVETAFILDITESMNLYVPVGAGELYKNTSPWNKFTKIIESSDL